MTFSVNFNGYELGEYIEVLRGFTPFVGANWQPSLSDTEGTPRGSDFEYTTYKSKVIPMPFLMRNDLGEKYDELQRILNVSEPKPLIFGNLPNRVFYAIPKETISFDEIVFLGKGTINWVIPESIARSTIVQQFPATLNSDGILEAIVMNNGSESAWLDYDIHMNHENGYIGVVSEYGAIQLGKVDETDTVPTEKSEWLVNAIGFEALNTWTTNAGFVPFKPSDFVKGGSWKSEINKGQTYLNWANLGTGTKYHGVTKQLQLPADSHGEVGVSDKWALQFKPWFANTQIEGGGVQAIILATADGKYRTGIMIQKDRRWNNNFKMIVFDGGLSNEGAATTKFTSKYFDLAEAKNKFTAWDSGMFEISKKGKQIVIKFPDGGTHTINDSDDSINYTNVTIMSAAHGSSTPLRNMGWLYVKLRKDNVYYDKDVPNRFAKSTDVYIDGEAGKAYENEKPIAHVIGSNFFLVPPGETKIQFSYSDFSDPRPDVIVSMREVYG